MTSCICLSVSNTKGWDYSSKIPSAIYSPRQEVWFSGVGNCTWKSDFFLMAPSIILLSDMEKRTKLFLITVTPKLMQEPTEILIYLKVLSRQEYVVIEIQSGFLLCKLPWKSDLFLMAPCIILLRDMKKRINFWLLFNLKFKSWILF